MKKGDRIETPRFLTVFIEEVYKNETDALENGHYEPTHYKDSKYGIYGKHTGRYLMKFAAFNKS